MGTLDIFSFINDERPPSSVQRKNLVRVTREGLPAETVSYLQQNIGFSPAQVEAISGVSLRTLQRHMESGKALSSVTSDRIVRALLVLREAVQTLGGLDNAKAWLIRPCAALGGDRPADLLDTDAGSHEVEAVLGRIRYGVFS